MKWNRILQTVAAAAIVASLFVTNIACHHDHDDDHRGWDHHDDHRDGDHRDNDRQGRQY